MTKVTEVNEKVNEKVTSEFGFEQIRIDEGYKVISENEDVTKTRLIELLGKLEIPATYISKMIETHYSFVHTVLTKNNIKVIEKKTKSDVMREMFDEGLTISQVSKKLNCHYSYVHGVYKRYESKKNKSK